MKGRVLHSFLFRRVCLCQGREQAAEKKGLALSRKHVHEECTIGGLVLVQAAFVKSACLIARMPVFNKSCVFLSRNALYD